MSATELAEALDRKPHTIRRYVRHDAEPKLELAEKLNLECSIAEVVGYEIENFNAQPTKPPPKIAKKEDKFSSQVQKELRELRKEIAS